MQVDVAKEYKSVPTGESNSNHYSSMTVTTVVVYMLKISHKSQV